VHQLVIKKGSVCYNNPFLLVPQSCAPILSTLQFLISLNVSSVICYSCEATLGRVSQFNRNLQEINNALSKMAGTALPRRNTQTCLLHVTVYEITCIYSFCSILMNMAGSSVFLFSCYCDRDSAIPSWLFY